jgi:hypothetical protein
MGSLFSSPVSADHLLLSPRATEKYLSLSDDVLVRVQFFLPVKERCANTAISTAHRRRGRLIFAHSLAAPLPSLLLDKQHIPTLLAALKAQLLAHRGQHLEGLFRHSSESIMLHAAIDVVERGDALTDGLALAGFSGDAHTVAHCCAALIKMWFRNRRPSLLGAAVSPGDIDHVADLVRSHAMIMGGAQSSEDTADADIPAEEAASVLIVALPFNARHVFLWLLDLLAGDVLDVEADNKMSAWNLAIIFAPTLYNEMDATNGLPWPDTLAQLRHCRNAAKFMLCAITGRRKQLKSARTQPRDAYH